MPGDHALLSPSSASRWIACPPSARLETQYPDTAGEAAAEGTLAHSLGELILQLRLERISIQKHNAGFKVIKKNPLYNAGMLAWCNDYAAYVLETFYAAQVKDPKAVIILETRLDLTKYIPEGFGTTDVTIITRDEIIVIDFKYGKGVLVEATKNMQAMVYALGSVVMYVGTHGIKTVTMTIYQPRIDNIDSYTMPVAELLDWGDEILVPAAAMAFKGEGDFKPGKHCKFCRVKNCRARADANMEIAKYDFAKAVTLEPYEISDILDKIKDLTAWAKDISEYALQTALKGKNYPGFKLVNGRSSRVLRYKDDLEDELYALGFEETEIIKRDLIGITELEEIVGKGLFNDKFGSFVIKPLGSPTLVPETDNRPALGIASAKNDFKNAYVETDQDPELDDLM